MDDAIEVTIERQIAPQATTIQPPAPVPEQPAPEVEASARAPTLDNAVPEPEPAPQPTLRDFPKTEPEKPAPKAEPDSNKALVPPPRTPPAASPPTPRPNQADAAQPDKARNERLARLLGTRYLERMGIEPSHHATLTETSGETCPDDPEPYKLEIANDKLTVTNEFGIMFSVTVPANGEIDELYKRAPMAGEKVNDPRGNWMQYRMMGNVKSGKLEIWYNHCVYKLNLGSKPDVNKALAPPPRKPPPPPSNPADKARNERLARVLGTRYLERMGITPSHQATLTKTSGRTCPDDPEPYKLEIANNKLTVTNEFGIMFSVTVPANGEIDELYKRAPMAGEKANDLRGNWMQYRMMGNVKSGKLEIWYINCVYKLILEP